jgi:hypothetical protein
MASMGFTQDSVKKLMNLLDSQEGMDEKTYVELSNAAKYLYEKTGNNTCAVQTAPPPTPDVEYLYQVFDLSNESDSDSEMGPGAVGRGIRRQMERIVHPAIQRAVEQHNQATAERINRPPTPIIEQRAQTRDVLFGTTAARPQQVRLCNRHKVTALIKIFVSLNFVVPNKGNDNDTKYIQRLYNILIQTQSVSHVEIKRRYYDERNADMLR